MTNFLSGENLQLVFSFKHVEMSYDVSSTSPDLEVGFTLLGGSRSSPAWSHHAIEENIELLVIKLGSEVLLLPTASHIQLLKEPHPEGSA